MRWLIDTYGWQGGMLIQAGIYLQATPFILLMTLFDKDKHSSDKPMHTKRTADTTSKEANDKCPKISSFLVNAFDLSLLRNYRVVLFNVSIFIHQAMVSVMFGLTVARAMWMGQSKYNAVVIVTCLGVGNSFGRLISGLLGDYFSRLLQCTIYLFLTGLFINGAALLHGFVLSGVAAGLVGLTEGMYYSVYGVLCVWT